MKKLYKNKITGVERELTVAAFNNLLPVYDPRVNKLLPNQGYVLLPNKPKTKRGKSIIEEINND